MFKLGEYISHTRGMTYQITEVPDGRRMENCCEPFYEYRAVADDQVWIRRKSEMEDGRFKLVS